MDIAPTKSPNRLRAWKLLLVLAGCAFASLWLAHTLAAQQHPAAVVVELFSRSGCSRCSAAEDYLLQLQRTRPELQIVKHDVVTDPRALAQLKQLSSRANFAQVAVPSIYLRGRLFVGFDSEATTGAALLRWLEEREEQRSTDTAEAAATCEAESTQPCPEPRSIADVPWLGTIDVRALGLPLFTVIMGLIDGFNPCAMWVLMFLLSMLVNLQDRARMALIGGTFVIVSGVVYFAFMAAWLNVFLLVGLSRALQAVLGVLAIAIGSIHVKDFFAFKRGVSLSIPDSAKPGIYRRAREVLRAERLGAAITGIVILAVLVNMIELLCTAGLPAIYTQVLASQGVSPATHYAYLALYNLAYMFDDAIMLSLAVVTLSQRKLQERGGRVLKLVSGSVIILLGTLLLFKPSWLAW